MAEMQRRLDLMTEQLKANEEQLSKQAINTTSSATPTTTTTATTSASPKPFVSSIGTSGPTTNAGSKPVFGQNVVLRSVANPPTGGASKAMPSKVANFPSATYDKYALARAVRILFAFV
jgi:hypothetical protein